MYEPFPIVIIWTMSSPRLNCWSRFFQNIYHSHWSHHQKAQHLHHMYADDIQLFLEFKSSDSTSIETALSRLSACICEIKVWMTKNMLKLNESKTEFFVAISHYNKRKLSLDVQLQIGAEIIKLSETVRNLGVLFDSELSMSPQITSLCTNLTYHLPNITRIRRFLDRDSCHHISDHLFSPDKLRTNAVLLGTKVANISRLQRLQNWAAKLIFCATKRDHETPFINELHWLTIKNRIIFKIMVIIYKCLNNLGPSYLASTLTRYSPAGTGLRSSCDTTRLTDHRVLPCTFKAAADILFCFAAPHMWNSLPMHLRSESSLQSFKKGLKAYLYTK